MPIYDYRCTQCGQVVEVMHSIAGSGPETCVACGGLMRKALSTPAIHFKGSGWAKKDAAASARKSKPKASGDDASSGGSKSSGDDAKSESGAKPETAGKQAGSASDAKTSSPPASSSSSKAD